MVGSAWRRGGGLCWEATRQAIAGPKGASMHVVCVSVPGKDHPPRGPFLLSACLAVASPAGNANGFRLLRLCRQTIAPLLPGIDVSESWLRKSRGVGQRPKWHNAGGLSSLHAPGAKRVPRSSAFLFSDSRNGQGQYVTSTIGRGMTPCMLYSTMPLCFCVGAILYLFPKAIAWVVAVSASPHRDGMWTEWHPMRKSGDDKSAL